MLFSSFPHLHILKEQNQTHEDIADNFDKKMATLLATKKRQNWSAMCLFDRIFFNRISGFLVTPCCSQGATLLVTLPCHWSVCLVVCPWQDPLHPPCNFHFQIFFFNQNCFHPKFFFTSKSFPTFTFLCISGCFMPS